MMSLKKLFFLVGILIASSARGQYSVELNSISGFKIFSPGNYNLSGMSFGGEVAFNISQENSDKEWVRRLRISEVSVVGGYHNMGAVRITDSLASNGFLQNVFTTSGRLNSKLFELKRISLSLTAGIGLAFSSSSYFTDQNPIVGSRLNFSPQAGLKLKTAVTNSLSLASSLNIFHYSNAGIKVPNNGVNSFQASLGLSYQLPYGIKTEQQTVKPASSDGFFELMLDVGRRGAWKSKAGNWKSGLALQYHYAVNPVISLKAGTDFVYYYTTFDGTNERYQYFATSYDPLRVGLSGGADVWLGNFVVGGNYGYYIKYDSFHSIKTYWTSGLKYYLHKNFGIQTKIYFHQAQADYIGFGVVVRK